MTYPLVEIVWLDATAEHSEITIDQLPELTVCRTVGRLLKETPEAVWIASELLEPSKPSAETMFRDTSVIPAGWIKKIRPLEKVKP